MASRMPSSATSSAAAAAKGGGECARYTRMHMHETVWFLNGWANLGFLSVWFNFVPTVYVVGHILVCFSPTASLAQFRKLLHGACLL